MKGHINEDLIESSKKSKNSDDLKQKKIVFKVGQEGNLKYIY